MNKNIKSEPNVEQENTVFEFSMENIKHEQTYDDSAVIEIDEQIFFQNSYDQPCQKLSDEETADDENFVFVDEIVKEEPKIHDTADHGPTTEPNENKEQITVLRSIEEKTLFTCEHCPATFHQRWLFNRHQSAHRIKKTFDCGSCARKFVSQMRLTAHERMHSSLNLYECQICHKKFTQKHSVAVHERIHLGENPYKCEHCNRRFRLKLLLTKHMKAPAAGAKHQSSRNQCGGIAKNRIVPMELMSEHPVEIRIFECYLCHVQCYKAELRKHISEMHCGDKMYACKMCKKNFINKYRLQRHVAMHTKKPELECTICGRQFMRKHALIEHFSTHLTSFQCKFCPKILSTKQILKTHLKTHTGIRPFACEFEFCTKTFLKRGDMVRHMRVHTGERPFKCNLCDKSFTRNHMLTEHLQNKHA